MFPLFMAIAPHQMTHHGELDPSHWPSGQEVRTGGQSERTFHPTLRIVIFSIGVTLEHVFI